MALRGRRPQPPIYKRINFEDFEATLSELLRLRAVIVAEKRRHEEAIKTAHREVGIFLAGCAQEGFHVAGLLAAVAQAESLRDPPTWVNRGCDCQPRYKRWAEAGPHASPFEVYSRVLDKEGA